MKESEKEKYELYSHLTVYRQRLTGAIESIKKAFSLTSDWVVCYSGGKDSTALLDLCVKYGNVKDMLFGKYRETPKENIEMAENMAKKYDLRLHIIELPGAFDVYEKVGHFFTEPKSEEERKWTNWMLKEYKKVMIEYIDGRWKGEFLGLRMKESKARMFALSKKKDLYRTKDRSVWTCTPLYRLDGNDIWAYIIENNLPYLKIYDNPMQDRERTRSEPTFLASEAIWRHGHGEFIKKYYPDIWLQIKQMM
ncbi:phosphoadenosine phosphosulfate reductase domain-containing protein [Aeribacillus sp. FSL M8-0235]|uniref:phosphoadenosine phosphosulfate reductase domain-containing protein n=1 Tax=Aeribacillus sp. FSL M8-0235 TaxID=2954576 RepID=UPI0030F7423B